MEKGKEGRLYSLKEMFVITYHGLFAVSRFRFVKSKNLLSSQFIERIMLAVTEVNGCDVCAKAHTKAALEAGMSEEEIEKILKGINDGVPEDEMVAIDFAKHYANSRGKPSKENLITFKNTYGPTKSEAMAAVIRTIMYGNAYGILFSSFKGRFKGKSDKRSSLPYEIGMILSSIVIFPVALILASFANISKTRFI